MLDPIEVELEKMMELVSLAERKRNPILRKIERRMKRVLLQLRSLAKRSELRCLNSQGRPGCLR